MADWPRLSCSRSRPIDFSAKWARKAEKAPLGKTIFTSHLLGKREFIPNAGKKYEEDEGDGWGFGTAYGLDMTAYAYF